MIASAIAFSLGYSTLSEPLDILSSVPPIREGKKEHVAWQIPLASLFHLTFQQ